MNIVYLIKISSRNLVHEVEHVWLQFFSHTSHHYESHMLYHYIAKCRIHMLWICLSSFFVCDMSFIWILLLHHNFLSHVHIVPAYLLAFVIRSMHMNLTCSIKMFCYISHPLCCEIFHYNPKIIRRILLLRALFQPSGDSDKLITPMVVKIPLAVNFGP